MLTQTLAGGHHMPPARLWQDKGQPEVSCHAMEEIMKKAYVVAEINVTNPTDYEGYRALSTDAVKQYGGQFLVRGGQREQREGEDTTHHAGWRTVIVEFPSLQQAQTWYDSPEYQKAMRIRQANSVGRLFIVEGA